MWFRVSKIPHKDEVSGAENESGDDLDWDPEFWLVSAFIETGQDPRAEITEICATYAADEAANESCKLLVRCLEKEDSGGWSTSDVKVAIVGSCEVVRRNGENLREDIRYANINSLGRSASNGRSYAEKSYHNDADIQERL